MLSEKIKEYLKETISVDISSYYNSHLKKPSTTVRAGWAFKFSKSEDEKPFFVSGTYSEALKQAKERAKKEGKSVVYLQA